MFARDYRQAAWNALKGKWGTMVVMFLIYGAITAACGIIPTVGSIAAIIIGGPLAIGFYGATLKVIRGEQPEVVDLFDGFKNNFTNALLLTFLNGLFIVLWSLLLVIPGIIKALSYSMSYFILAENPGMSQADARRASMVMMEGNKWRLFCLELSFIGWAILSGLTAGILSLWVTPYMYTAVAAFYEDLKAQQAPVVQPAPVEAVPEVAPAETIGE